MAFRIRCVDLEHDEYKSKEKLYRDHLEKAAKDKDRDLWKYFYWDTFHDGCIEKVSFWENPGTITFHITCPNIKKRKGDSFEFINPIEFECHFRDVVYFAYEHESMEEMAYEQHDSFEYLYSEIDSLTERINNYQVFDEDGDKDIGSHSLIMEVMGRENSFYIEMVFSSVDINPKEPIAFELMLASKDFFVPIYNENEDIDKLPAWI